jgi:hypothetical protein
MQGYTKVQVELTKTLLQLYPSMVLPGRGANCASTRAGNNGESKSYAKTCELTSNEVTGRRVPGCENYTVLLAAITYYLLPVFISDWSYSHADLNQWLIQSCTYEYHQH